MYDIALSDANAVSLADGTNYPSDVEGASLVYYWPLLSDPNDDESTNDLTEHNSPSYDTSDHPLAVIQDVSGTISASASLTGSASVIIGASSTVSATASLSGLLTHGPLAGSKVERYKKYLVGFGNDTVSYESA